MIYDNVTAALDKGKIEWCVFGQLDEKYPFFVMLEKAPRVLERGQWFIRYDLHLVYGEDDDMDEVEEHVLDTLIEYNNCYTIDSVSGLRKMVLVQPVDDEDPREWDFTTIRVVIRSV